MKKIFTTLLCGMMTTVAFGQWSSTSMKGEQLRQSVEAKSYYALDLNAIRTQLNNAQEQGKGNFFYYF